jgi:DNA-directed RNA polymerase specialized sigma subunit
LKNDLRVLKISNTRLKKGLDTKVKTEEDLRKELQAIEATKKKLQEQHNAEMQEMQLNHASDMKIPESDNTRLNWYYDKMVKIEMDLREELQAIKATNKLLQEQQNAGYATTSCEREEKACTTEQAIEERLAGPEDIQYQTEERP